MSFHHRSKFEKPNRPFKHAKAKTRGRIQTPKEVAGTNLSMSRDARINQQKQLRQHARNQVLISKRFWTHTPRIIAMIPLSASVDCALSCHALLREDWNVSIPKTFSSGKNKFTLISGRDGGFACLDAAKAADVVVFLMKAGEDADEHGISLLSTLAAQGLPAAVGAVQGCVGLGLKEKNAAQKLASRVLMTSLGDHCQGKIFPLDSEEDAETLLRHVHDMKLRDLSWRENRGYLAVEQAEVAEDALILEGVYRSSNGIKLSPNRLVHVSGYGDFEISRVAIVDADGDLLQEFVRDETVAECLQIDPPDTFPTMEDDHEYPIIEDSEDDEESKEEKPSKSTDHLKAWEMELGLEKDDGSEMDFNDEDMDDDGKLELKYKLERTELEFPDEVDTPGDQLANLRFRKYRGLESFTKSPWEEEGFQNVPEEFKFVTRFQDFRATRNRVVEDLQGIDGASSGQRVRVFLVKPTMDLVQAIERRDLILISTLFKYEREISLVHFHVRRYDGYSAHEAPIQSKEIVDIQSGFRRFSSSVLYSEDSKADKHKINKFFLPGSWCIASTFAQVQFGPSNVLMFHPESGQILASGTLDSIDPDRVLIKRIILTGYPMRVSKRRAVVRYMFFAPEDVRWFKPVSLWTKFGLQGRIDEPVGTHGLFKATFSGVVKQCDTVCLSLYKRQFPRFQPWLLNSFKPQ
jgi:pre-rRNA-processing protein TSR1